MSKPSRAARTALRQRAEIVELLKRLTPEVIEELDRRSRFVAVPDGWPAGGGSEVRGSEVSRPTELAVLARGESFAADPVGDKIRDLFGAVAEAAGVLGPVDRWLTHLQSYGAAAVPRDSSLAGDCKCCLRPVAGGAQDPIRNGYCNACRMAYSRWSEGHPVGDDPAAHRMEFERDRRPRLAESELRRRPAAELPAGSCGHRCCEVAGRGGHAASDHWRSPGECDECAAAAQSGGQVAS